MIVHTSTGDETFELDDIVSITFSVNGFGVYVEGGTYDMGDHFNEGYDHELPVHSVTVDDFYIDMYEVTHAKFIEFLNDLGVESNGSYNGTELIDMDDTACAISYDENSFYFSGSNYATSEDCPVIVITWYGAVVYCNWCSQIEGLNTCYDLTDWSCDFSVNNTYRLPTEAEWQYAARGGVNWTDDYRYSGCHLESDLPEYAWYDFNSEENTHEVGFKLPNQLNIYDMSGNVLEWCWDWYASDYYSYSPQNNPTGPENGTGKIVMGGSWNYGSLQCRVAHRNAGGPYFSSDSHVGFRILRTVE